MTDKNIENENKGLEKEQSPSDIEEKNDIEDNSDDTIAETENDNQETSEIQAIEGNEVLIKDKSEKNDQVDVDDSKDESRVEDKETALDESDELEEEEKSNELGIVGTLFSVIGNTIFALFLIVLLLIVGLNVVSFARGEEISLLGKRMYIIGEDTMDPVVSEDDAIIVEERSSANVNEGDFIVYETVNGEFVTGWVSNLMDDDRLEVKKDVNSENSIIIDGIALIGVATVKIANMGEFIEFISNPLALLLILLVGIFIYMIVWFISNLTKRLAS